MLADSFPPLEAVAFVGPDKDALEATNDAFAHRCSPSRNRDHLLPAASSQSKINGLLLDAVNDRWALSKASSFLRLYGGPLGYEPHARDLGGLDGTCAAHL